MSDRLPARLRTHAKLLRGMEAAQSDIYEAADRLEAFEAAERDRLEHEAVSPEIDLGPDEATFTPDEAPSAAEIAEHIDALMRYVGSLADRISHLENGTLP